MTINPGRDLAALRPMTIKPCDTCGAMFTGLKRKTQCEKCRNLAKTKRYQEKLKKL
jgi:hypothetical protein